MMMKMQKEYADVLENESNVYFKGYCMDGRLPGEPIDWEKMMGYHMDDEDWDWERMEELQNMFDDVEVTMDDNSMTITGDGMRIEMREDEDGSGSLHIVLESATKLAASALSLGAAMTLF